MFETKKDLRYNMRTETVVLDNKFLKLKSVNYPEKNVGRYFFAERLGVDSIAFICFDKVATDGRYLLNNEYKPPIDEFVLGAFGGSLDSNKSKKEIVKGEAREEAGFEVGDDDIHWVGRVLVSTQMNQYCDLYVVGVDPSKELERKPENAIEAMATTKWVTAQEAIHVDDWKATTILFRFLFELPKKS